jgi:hypothetical protein
VEIQDRLNKLDEEVKHITDLLRNLEMAIVPLADESIRRICWITHILQPVITPLKMIRVGNFSDGGYVISPPPVMGSTLSIGVGYDISADLNLIEEFQHTVYAFDPYVDRPIHAPEEFKFHKLGFSSSATIQSGELHFEDMHSIMTRIPSTPDLALIDIEGSEWGLVDSFDAISSIPQIVIEFHDLDRVIEDSKFAQIKNLLEEIMVTHLPIHVHANNDGSNIRLAGAVWPSILEVTFADRNLVQNGSLGYSFGPWPGPLDFPNSVERPDLDLQPFFGAFAKYRSPLRS